MNQKLEKARNTLAQSTWNDTPAAFLQYAKLVAATLGISLDRMISEVANLPGVRGQADLAQACLIARSDDREHFCRFITAVERLRAIRHSISEQAMQLEASFELIEELIHLSKEECNQNLLPHFVRMTYAAYHLCECLPVAASDTSSIAFDLAIALEDLQDAPDWGKDQVSAVEHAVSLARQKWLNPHSPTSKRDDTRGLVTPLLSRLAEASQKDRRKVLLDLCGLVINAVAQGMVTALDIGKDLHQTVDYPELMADESLHPLLLSIAYLECPGEICGGMVENTWQAFVHAYYALVDH